MPVSPACIAAVKSASGDALNDNEAAELIRKFERHRDRLIQEGKVDGLESRLRELAAQEADATRLDAALKRKNVARTIIARDRLETTLDARMEGGRLDPVVAFRSLLEGTTHNVRDGRVSVQATKLAYESEFFGDLIARVTAERPHIERLLRDKPFNDDIVREMIELRDGGRPGITRNPDAKYMANLFAEFSDRSRLALNRLGANIGKLDGWAGPQVHDSARLLTFGQDAWVEAILPKLDLDRSLPNMTADEARAALRDIWTTITTGRGRGTTAKGRGEVTGPANLASQLGEHRVLHFRSANDWLAYNEQFGHGHIWDSMVAHQRRSAQTAALMEHLGPNPRVMADSMLDRLQGRVRDSATIPEAKKAKLIAKLQTEGTAIGNAMDEAMGLTLMPVNVTMAQISSGIRAVQSMAKLGGAVLSSLTDLVTRASGLTYQGKPIFQAYADQIGDFMQGRGAGEQREIAAMLGEGFDGLIDHINSAFVAGDTMPGKISGAMTTFFRASGLTWWTDAMRASQARMISSWMGEQASKGFDRLSPEYRRVLQQHGLGAEHWEAIRRTAWVAENGRTYVTPQRIADLPDEAIMPLIADRLGDNPAAARTARLLREGRHELELSLRAFFADEVNFGVIETDAASRRLLLQGTRPGTLVGEAFRFFAQFKGFPVAFTQRVLGRAVNGADGTLYERMLSNKGHIGHLVAGLAVAGYASMTLKDVVAGRTPRDPAKPETILAALAQSGGAGIYGDFLFGQANRFGNGPLATFVLGPVGATADSAVDLWLKARDGEVKAGDALNLALQNTPFANLWYARPALDMLVLNSMRESLSPGFLARQERDRRKEYGQTYWAPRTVF